MTINEILHHITVLKNNSIQPIYFIWVQIIGCGLFICVGTWCIIQIVNDRDLHIPIINSRLMKGQNRGYFSHIFLMILMIMMMLGCAIAVISGIYVLTNEQAFIKLTSVELYVNLNDVSLEDITRYFKLDNVTAMSENVYAEITPIPEHSMEIKSILHSMDII